jgi:dihydrofolate reductase
MDTTESSAPHAHPSIEDHDDTVEAHYACLERPCCCLEGWVFKLTLGAPLIMGRKTHDSIGKPLPGRRNIVVTRRPGAGFAGCEVAHSLDEALALAGDAPEVFVIGGAELYRLALPRADRLYLTLVDAEYPGDTVFPELDRADWRETAREPGDGFTFVTCERTRPA